MVQVRDMTADELSSRAVPSAPERLSTFGGRDRSMWWKLIGHDSNHDRRNARAYTLCEIGRIGTDGLVEYVIIGAGLDATKVDRSSVKASSWTTSARVDIEFDLMHSGREPLTAPLPGWICRTVRRWYDGFG